VVASIAFHNFVGHVFIEDPELATVARRIISIFGGTKCQEVVKRIETFAESIEKISSD
jgi:hypothetical protein